LIGLTLHVPLLGAAVGGVAGAAGGALTNPGIDETFMNRLRDAITPGRSSLLTIGPGTAWDLVAAVAGGPERAEVVTTEMTEITERQLSALREIFAT
jgi:uncharacterized membrane protein